LIPDSSPDLFPGEILINNFLVLKLLHQSFLKTTHAGSLLSNIWHSSGFMLIFICSHARNDVCSLARKYSNLFFSSYHLVTRFLWAVVRSIVFFKDEWFVGRSLITDESFTEIE